MRVKLNCTYYHAKGMAAPDEELDVSDKDGKDLVAQGLAVAVETKRAAKKVAGASDDGGAGSSADGSSQTDGEGDGAGSGAGGTGQTDNPDTTTGGQQ